MPINGLNRLRCGIEELAAAFGREDELRAAVARIWSALDVSEPLELVDELRACRKTELCPVGKLREADAFAPDVPKHVVVGEADPRKARWVVVGHELAAEVLEQAVQDLARGPAPGTGA